MEKFVVPEIGKSILIFAKICIAHTVRRPLQIGNDFIATMPKVNWSWLSRFKRTFRGQCRICHETDICALMACGRFPQAMQKFRISSDELPSYSSRALNGRGARTAYFARISEFWVCAIHAFEFPAKSRHASLGGFRMNEVLKLIFQLSKQG